MHFGNTLNGASVLSTINQTYEVNLYPKALRPMECPCAPALFVDREAERAVFDMVHESNSVRGVLCAGIHGIGRISCIERWVEEKADSLFPDGVLYLDYDNYRQGAGCDVIRAMRDKLATLSGGSGVAQVSDADLSNRYRSLTAGKRLLVILKDAKTHGEIVQFMPNSSKSMLIATVPAEYESFPGDNCIVRSVNPLNHSDAKNYFVLQ